MLVFSRILTGKHGLSGSDIQSRRKPVPIKKIYLHVTKSCNLQCSYCYFSSQNRVSNELTLNEFDKLFSEIVTLNPMKIIFTGGEPLLRSDILQLIRCLRDADPENRIVRCLNTNGHLVTKEIAHALVDLVDEVRVSLDALRQRNDLIRGTGNFDNAIQAINTLYSVGFEPKVLITFTSVSAPDLEELVCLLLSKGIKRISVNEFRPIGRGLGRNEWQVDISEAQKVIQHVYRRYGIDVPSGLNKEPLKTSRNCGVGQFLNIMPNGDVFPCHALTQQKFHCGNIREHCLLDICQSGGLLGVLQSMDFNQLAFRDQQRGRLIGSGGCMAALLQPGDLG